jgi:flagellar M-ring protein FliF
VESLNQLIAKFGAARFAILTGIVVAVAGFFIFASGRLAQPELALLYSDVDPADAGRIVSRLEALKVPVQLSADGTRIMVPQTQAARLRMQMAEEGLPSGGSMGYELFDRASALGTTSFAQRVNHLRALEGELVRSIRTMAPVKSARVHLVLPRREPFQRETQEPSGSIIVSMRSGQQLQRTQVQALQQLVAAAVPRLKPNRISVIDDKGNLLARANEEGNDGYGAAQSANELRVAQETRMSRTIEQLLERAIGFGKVRAEVAARMDFDRVTTKAEMFDPNGQVVRSTQTVNEDNSSNEVDKGPESVSVQNNLPDRNEQGTPGAQRNTKGNRAEETVNFEVSRTTRTHVQEGGNVQRLSVAVLVDGTYSAGADGKLVYQPRSAEDMKQLEALVKNAIGYDDSRGDTVEIANMRFARADDERPIGDDERGFLELDKADILRLVELIVIVVLVILVALLVVRPILNRLLEPASRAAGMDGSGQAALPGAENRAQLAGPGGEAGALISGEAAGEVEDTMIDISMVEGRIKESSLTQITQIIEKHPEEALSVIRNWMYEGK